MLNFINYMVFPCVFPKHASNVLRKCCNMQPFLAFELFQLLPSFLSSSAYSFSVRCEPIITVGKLLPELSTLSYETNFSLNFNTP